MTSLTILSNAAMGPLEVTVYPPDGDPIDLTLSSGKTEDSVKVPSGRSTVVARWPSGVRIRRFVDIGEHGGELNLAEGFSRSPNEFMQDETLRGLITAQGQEAPTPTSSTEAPLAILPAALHLQIDKALLGVAAAYPTAFGPAVTQPSPYPGEHLGKGNLPSAAIDALLRGDSDVVRTAQSSRSYQFFVWRRSDGLWLSNGLGVRILGIEKSPDFYQVALDTTGLGPICMGLLDQDGLGPMVMLPAFRCGLKVTFLASGMLINRADRSATPGGQRAPVALVSLVNTSAADLLSALAAASTSSAKALWDQAAPGLAPELGHELSLELLADKFERPAEALLAAHYLLRFLPERLPVRWADNLIKAMPEAADGPVIAAWSRLLNPKAGEVDDVDAAVHTLLKCALSRPVTLFARTRSMLMQGLRLLNQSDLAPDLLPKAEAYFRAGAGAGGLECFWGGGPDLPNQAGPKRPAFLPGEVKLEQGRFLTT